MNTNNIGNDMVRRALRLAREDANRNRIHGIGDDRFMRGMSVGKILAAENYLDADPLLVMGAKNELRFLGRYSEGRA